MDKINTLELDILITIRQNKTIPASKFHELFEHKWINYILRFNELKSQELFKVSSGSSELDSYELTSKGNKRIAHLLGERENEVARMVALQKQKNNKVTIPTWKLLFGIPKFLRRSSSH